MAAGWKILAWRGVDTALAVPFHQSAMADWSWQNMPSAATYLFGSSRHVCKLDLSTYTEARLVVRIMSAGVSGSKLALKYKTSFAHSDAASTFSDIGTSAVEAVLTSTGVAASSWIALASGAQADVFVAIIGSLGDGAADPQIGSVVAQFR